VLKETFSSLKELRIRIRDKRSHKEATDWITACLILYNILLPSNNWSTDQPLPAFTEDNDDHGHTEDDYTSEDKRMALYFFVMDKLAGE